NAGDAAVGMTATLRSAGIGAGVAETAAAASTAAPLGSDQPAIIPATTAAMASSAMRNMIVLQARGQHAPHRKRGRTVGCAAGNRSRPAKSPWRPARRTGDVPLVTADLFQACYVGAGSKQAQRGRTWTPVNSRAAFSRARRSCGG